MTNTRRCVSRALLQVPSLALCMGWAFLAISFSGCGDRGPERVVVTGTVSYNGKPIPEGNIRFMPVATSAMPMSGAGINEGKYRVDGKGGLAVGTYKIEIEALRKDPKAASPMASRGVPLMQYLPKRFNADSKLQITVESGSREITKNFDLTE